jgi:hypothetical protein
MSKPFSKELYDDDDDAKYVVIGWLERQGYAAWVNPDQYGIDVLALKDFDEYGFEVEVKHNWTGDRFPFGTVHFSARKQKFVAPNHFFTMLNDARSCVLVVDGGTLASARVVSKETKYTSGELFIEVPVGRCVLYRLD